MTDAEETAVTAFRNDVPMKHPSEVSAQEGEVARTYTTRCKKALVQKIQTLDNTDHEEIFAKLKAHGIPHSQNTNGAFVNLTFVPCAVIAEIEAFVDYCTKNQRALDEYDMKLNACKLHQKYDTLLSIHDTSAAETDDTTTTPDEASASADVPPVREEDDAEKKPSAVEDQERRRAAEEEEAASIAAANPKKVSTKFVAAKKKFAKKKGGGEGATDAPHHNNKGGGGGGGKKVEASSSSSAADPYHEELTPE